MERNSCYTYFAIRGDFKHEDITKRLNLTPCDSWNTGDLSRFHPPEKERRYTFSCWKYGICNDYDIDIPNMMRKTIKDLIPKKAELLKIREDYDAGLYLEVVPEIYVPKDDNDTDYEPHPVITPSRDIIEFLYETKTELDIDYYIFPY